MKVKEKKFMKLNRDQNSAMVVNEVKSEVNKKNIENSTDSGNMPRSRFRKIRKKFDNVSGETRSNGS